MKDRNRVRGIINGIYNRGAKNEFGKVLDKMDPKNTIIHVHGWTKSLSSSIFVPIFKSKFNCVLTLHDYFSVCPNGGFFNYNTEKSCNLCPMSVCCLKSNCDSRNYLFKIYRVIRQFVQSNIVGLPKRVKNVIAVSEFSWSIIKPYLGDNVKPTIISNPIGDDLDRHRVFIEEESPFVFIGRVEKEKGVELFCKAARRAGVPAVVIGDGHLLPKLREEYKEINFAGWLESEDLKKRMDKSRAVVFPSLAYETAGLAVINALSVGLPVITSNLTAAKEYVTNDKNGFIFEHNCVDDLADKLIKMDVKTARRLGEFAFYNYDTKEYSCKNYVRKLTDVYKKILEGDMQ